MRPVLLALALLVSLTAQAAEPAPVSLELGVLPDKPRPGQRVFWRLSLRNVSGRTLYVPAEVQERLFVGGTFMADEEGAGGYGIGGIGGETARLPAAWIALPANGSIEQTGEAGDIFPECSGGCRKGRVLLGGILSLPPLPAGAELPTDHVVPTGLRADAQVDVQPPEVEFFECDGVGSVAAQVLGARAAKDGLRLRVRLENRTQAPLWMPKPALIAGSCSVEAIADDGSRSTSSAPGSVLSPREGVDERALVLVQPKRALETEVACPGAQLPRRGTIRLTLDVPSVLVPRRVLVPPFVWTGLAEVPPFAVGAR